LIFDLNGSHSFEVAKHAILAEHSTSDVVNLADMSSQCTHTPNLEHFNSKFSCSYPSKEATEFAEETRRGYFEDLVLYCALDFFQGNAESLKPLVQMNGGIFAWESCMIECLKTANIQGANSLHDKQLNMVGYLVEVGYELCLSFQEYLAKCWL
jgi:hypothetical protein